MQKVPRTDYNAYRFSHTPLLCIGMGGMGSHAALLLRWKLFRIFNRNPESDFDADNFSFARFICVDTDNLEDIETIKYHLSENERMNIGNASLEDVQKLLTNDSLCTEAKLLKSSEESVQEALKRPDNFQDGAGQIRMFGRCCLLMKDNLDKFQQKVKTALLKLNIPENDYPGYFSPNEGGGGRKAHILIICSLSGGTGSGTFIDAAGAINHLLQTDKKLRENGYTQGHVTISAIIVLPSCLQGDDDSEIIINQANAYAALKELDHYLSGNEYQIVNPSSRDTGRSITVSNSKQSDMLFQHVFLFEGTSNETTLRYGSPNVTNSRLEISDAISDFITATFLSKYHDNFFRRLINWVIQDGIYSKESARVKYPPCKKRFSSFGITTGILPTNDIVEVFKLGLMVQIVNMALNYLESVWENSEPELGKYTNLLGSLLPMLYRPLSGNEYDFPVIRGFNKRAFTEDRVPGDEYWREKIDQLIYHHDILPKNELQKAIEYFNTCIKDCLGCEVSNKENKIEQAVKPHIFGPFEDEFKKRLTDIGNDQEISIVQEEIWLKEVAEELAMAISSLQNKKERDVKKISQIRDNNEKAAKKHIDKVQEKLNDIKDTSRIAKFFFRKRKQKFNEAIEEYEKEVENLGGALKNFFLAHRRYVLEHYNKAAADVHFKILKDVESMVKERLNKTVTITVLDSKKKETCSIILGKVKDKIASNKNETINQAESPLDIKPDDDKTSWISRWKIWPSKEDLDKMFHELKTQCEIKIDVIRDLSQKFAEILDGKYDKIVRDFSTDGSTEDQSVIIDNDITDDFYTRLKELVENLIEEYGVQDKINQQSFQNIYETGKFGNLLSFDTDTHNKIRTRLRILSKPFIQLTSTPTKKYPSDSQLKLTSDFQRGNDKETLVHNDKVTFLNIECGFSVINIRALHEWRSAYLHNLADNGLPHCYSDAEDYIDLCYDHKVTGMNSKYFLELMIIYNILDKNRDILSLANIDDLKGLYLNNRLIAVSIKEDVLLKHIENDPPTDYYLRHLLISNYLEMMQEKHPGDSGWVVNRAWIKTIFDGPEGRESERFKRDIKADFQLIKDNLAKIEKTPEAHDMKQLWKTIFHDMAEDGFMEIDENGNLEVNLDEYPSEIWEKAGDVKITGNIEDWQAELAGSWWFLEKLVIVVANRIKVNQPISESQKSFLREYNTKESARMPEILRNALLTKI
ncbi:tubulin-like doman-containing protein [Thermodesulfobacteriota bacterium]